MNVTEFIQLLNDIKDKLNSQDKAEVVKHLDNLASKPIVEDKLNDAMNFVKGHINKNGQIFPEEFANKSANFMGLGASDLIQNENDFQKAQKNKVAASPNQQIGNNKNALFAANKPKSKTPGDGGWDLCTQVLLACFPVVGWALLAAYHCGCFTPDNEVPAGPAAPNK